MHEFSFKLQIDLDLTEKREKKNNKWTTSFTKILDAAFLTVDKAVGPHITRNTCKSGVNLMSGDDPIHSDNLLPS